MSWPNLLTLSRIPFLFLVTGCLFLPSPGPLLALVFFIIAAATDWADGWLARKTGDVSDFGKLMDALADKILMVGMIIVLLSTGLLPQWCLFLVLLIVTRELWITGLRMVAANRGVVLAAEKLGKYKTVFQILAAAFLLLGQSLRVDFSLPASGTIVNVVDGVGLTAFVIATILTVVSGTVYLWKYRALLSPKTA